MRESAYHHVYDEGQQDEPDPEEGEPDGACDPLPAFPFISDTVVVEAAGGDQF